MTETIRLERVDWTVQKQLLAQWLQSPAVRRWWGDPVECLEAIEQTPVDRHAVIAVDGEAIGYIRWQAVVPEELDALGLTDIPSDAIDIDLFIGEGGWRGRGVAVSALGQLTDRLRRESGASAAGLGTSIENKAAHRAFEKAGFENRVRFDDPIYGPCFIFLKDLRR